MSGRGSPQMVLRMREIELRTILDPRHSTSLCASLIHSQSLIQQSSSIFATISPEYSVDKTNSTPTATALDCVVSRSPFVLKLQSRCRYPTSPFLLPLPIAYHCLFPPPTKRSGASLSEHQHRDTFQLDTRSHVQETQTVSPLHPNLSHAQIRPSPSAPIS